MLNVGVEFAGGQEHQGGMGGVYEPPAGAAGVADEGARCALTLTFSGWLQVAALQAMVDVVCQTDEYVVNDGKHTREYAEKLELELIEARLNIAQLRCEYDLLMSTKRTKRGRVGGRPVRAKKPTAWSKLNHVIRFAGAAKPKKPTTS
eukprot:TRINITY_DN8925_c0_g1_i1.p2 TRINITY_DN8925_c0_g1~~TRINITY_DN8925_c0_g1_i1.p2  ORF type:complete len:148 (-),score=34.37 TRINITY_DN8925_c0_g1_i1:227-670(-)